MDLVFDVGQVLIRFHIGPFKRFLRQFGARIRSTEEFLKETDMRRYERGLVSSEKFLASVNSLFENPIDKQQLVHSWTKMFSPVPEMLDLIDRLKQRHRIFLLTNTNELHWEFLEQNYRLGEHAQGVITSFEAGAAKPEEKIYRIAEERFGLTPAETIFIDDIPEHIAAAEKRGWKGIVHTSYDETTRKLSAYGIDTG